MLDISQLNILYVEDESELREHVAFALRLHINNVLAAANGQEALDLITLNRPDIVISDIRMPIMDGLDLTATLRQKYPSLPVLLCTAFTDTDYLLKAIELGVAAYIPKPIDTARLLEAISQAAQPVLQRREIQRLKFDALRTCGILIDSSPSMKTLGEQITQVAGSDYSVVVSGEAGTGKSAVAELLHGMSRRSSKRLLSVNCRSRSGEQLELELFGKNPGRGRPPATRDCGTLREIDGGTLLLDAPELLPLPLLERILTTLEQHAYCPTGGTESLRCEVRVVVVTTADLAREVTAGRFPCNLWLRLSEVVLNIPPLRERTEDIPPFCRAYLAQAADDLGRPCPEISPEAIKLLQKELWPGNFRQLKQFIRRAVFHAGDLITVADLKPLLAMNRILALHQMPRQEEVPSLKLAVLEEWGIRKALQATDGKKMQAAVLLGISYNAFKEKIRRYGIV